MQDRAVLFELMVLIQLQGQLSEVVTIFGKKYRNRAIKTSRELMSIINGHMKFILKPFKIFRSYVSNMYKKRKAENKIKTCNEKYLGK